MENVVTDLAKAESTFTLKPGKRLEPAVLRKAVVDAGFTPRDIFIAARGKVREEHGKLIFQPLSSDQIFRLIPGAEANKLEADGPKEVGLRGRVMGDVSPLSLEVQEFQN